MTFEITEGASNADIRRHIRELDRKLARGIRQGFFKVGSLLKTTAREQMMEKPKHGRLYKLKKGPHKITGMTSFGKVLSSQNSYMHRASNAYETPANFTGALRKSIGFEQAGMVLQLGAGGRGSGVDYAKYLEYGTRRGLFPRPLLGNAVEKQEGAIMPMMQEAVGHEINLLQGQ